VTRLTRLLVIAAIAVAGVAYLALSHLLTIAAHPSTLMLALGVTPLTILALLATWHSRMRWFALPLLAMLALTALMYLEEFRDHINWLYFIQHAGTMILLAITFARTLRRGDSDALCSRVTQLMLLGQADPAYMRYTWNVTMAWTLYFVNSAVLSVGLFFLGPITVWSWFANLITPVIIGLMFVIEYVVRVRVLPNRAHFSIVQTIQAYRSYQRR